MTFPLVPVGFKIEAENFGIAAAQEIYTPADLMATARRAK